MGVITVLKNKGLINPPSWLPDNMQYETIMGSVAYGVSDDLSDTDIYGFCIPPKDNVFPHLRGKIVGFGEPYNPFQQYQEHHIYRNDNGRTYDVVIFSIIKYIQLCMDNNPNIIDSLFTPVRCVQHITPIGQLVRDNRKLFLHKGLFDKFRGYAFSQLHKMEIKTPQKGSKREASVKEYGFDVKFAYHVVRLVDEAEQLLMNGDVDLTKNREQLKAIRRGEWKPDDIKNWFNDKEEKLSQLHANSHLPNKPDEAKIKELLLNCLEQHYGSLDKAIVIEDKAIVALRHIKEIVDGSL